MRNKTIEIMNQFWDQRYRVEEYVYGKEPNSYFRYKLSLLEPGKILLPGEGEGRNAVFAASSGWAVEAFDPSVVGQKKAFKLAAEKEVKIDYVISSYLDFEFKESSFDAVGLFFTHQPVEMRTPFHKHVIHSLKPGGHLLMEAFHKTQINRNTGGPGSIDLLFDEAELRADFSGLEIIELNVLTRSLHEGLFHTGDADVIQLLAKKPAV